MGGESEGGEWGIIAHTNAHPMVSVRPVAMTRDRKCRIDAELGSKVS